MIVLKSEIKSGIVLSYVFMAISMVMGLVYTPVMLDLIGQSEYGLYTLATSVIGYLTFLNLGLESALIKYSARYIAQGDVDGERRLGGSFLKLYSMLGAVALVIGVFVAFTLEPGMPFGFLAGKLTASETETLKILILLMTVNLALSFPLGVYGAAITAHEKFTFRKVISVIRELSMPVVVLLVLFFGAKTSIALVLIHVIFNVAVLLSDYVYARKKLGYKVKFGKMDKKVLREIANYSVFIFIGMVVDRISDATNSMVLGAVSGTVAVAVYGIAVQLNHYYLNFSSSIGSFFFPRIVSMSVKEASDKELSDLFIKVGRVQLFVISLICSGFIVFGHDFIRLWVGEEYMMAYYMIVILMVPTLISRSQSLGTQILLAKDKHKFRAIFYLVVVLADIAISIPLAMWFGQVGAGGAGVGASMSAALAGSAEVGDAVQKAAFLVNNGGAGLGAAIGTAAATIIGPVIVMNIYYKKVMHLDIGAYFKSTVPILLEVAVLTALGMVMNTFWRVDGWLILGAQVLIYLVVFLVTMYFISFNKYEKSLVGGVLGKLKRR